ncbi:Derlin 1 [Podila epicladia]|nr:Derlin 1 [Podila epicladia]
MLFLHSYGSQLESSTFAERPADFAWFLLFTCLTTSVVGHFMHFAFMFQALLASIIYLWSQVNADRTVSFMFGLTFKAVYFPWVHFSYNYVLMDATVPWTMLVGIASAHLFYFLDSLYPDMGGPKLISTPALLYRFLPSEEVAGAEFTAGGGMAANFRLGEGEAGARRAAGVRPGFCIARELGVDSDRQAWLEDIERSNWEFLIPAPTWLHFTFGLNCHFWAEFNDPAVRGGRVVHAFSVSSTK